MSMLLIGIGIILLEVGFWIWGYRVGKKITNNQWIEILKKERPRIPFEINLNVKTNEQGRAIWLFTQKWPEKKKEHRVSSKDPDNIEGLSS